MAYNCAAEELIVIMLRGFIVRQLSSVSSTEAKYWQSQT
jgi:hypothetical protein